MAADSGTGAAAKTEAARAEAVAAPRTTARGRSLRVAALLVVVVGAAALPLFVSGFRLFQFTQVLIYAIALLGLNLLTGYNGQFSLGHGAFYGIGAYTTAIMIDRWGIGYGWTIPAAGIVCLVVGFLFGRPALRLEGLYLALATFSLALAVPQVLKYFEDWTGGSQGIVLSKPKAPLHLPLTEDQWLYFLTLAVAIVLFVLAANLLGGRTGRAIVAIRDNHIAAEAMGINNALYKSVIFGVSAAYTGIAGALSAIVIAFVAPDSFDVFLSITLLTGIVIGGFGTISGAIYGALFIQFVPNWAQDISKAAPWAIFGLFLIGFMYVMPRGIAGFLHLVWIRATRQGVTRGEGR
jgi:branched-chain amino acid transport system permease protein